jgi:hypothetical protein
MRLVGLLRIGNQPAVGVCHRSENHWLAAERERVLQRLGDDIWPSESKFGIVEVVRLYRNSGACLLVVR